ncbi:hypothetical protein DFH11DRAFT_1690084 [Phellopilus nigrolimitatus]|nr:hypothetical protein DFH11DRAFT_1690084 [Phellopilus nigrolimitatus]
MSPSSTSSSSPIEDLLSIGSDSENSDDLSKNLEILEKLRRNVHKNLRLRPLRSSTAPPDSPASAAHITNAANAPSDTRQHRSENSAPSPAFSIYYTPTNEFGPSPSSARYIGNGFSRDPLNTPVSLGQHSSLSPVAAVPAPAASSPASRSPPPQDLNPDALFARLASSCRPLLIDTRPPASYLSSRIQHSLNIAIPSLIMRRCTKPGGGLPSLDTLRTYISTDKGKSKWDEMVRRNSGSWDGDIVIYDEMMDEKDRDNSQVLSWAIVRKGGRQILKGGISAARGHPLSHHYITAGEEESATEFPTNLRSDDTSPRKGGFDADIEPPSTSPGPLLSSSNHNMLCDLSPSPFTSTSVFPQYAKSRRCSIPNLRRLDTTRQTSSSSLRSNSPSHLTLSYSNKSGPSSTLVPPGLNSSNECLSPQAANANSSSSRSPSTPMGFPASPATARPELDQPPTTEEPLPQFSVSTILPNFLYLGPELTLLGHVEELRSLGVKRILNIAIECDDDQGLRLREKFERYTRIPMRDIVEEENVARSVREACEALDDARLHSAPTYVHCKAGKSRSVTAVIAYLIHANHWTLSRAYAFVTERRKGISPNIGFVSELMTFEEQELGGKSVGVVNSSSAANGSDMDDYGGGKAGHYTAGARRTGNMRESLPPLLATQNSDMIIPGQMSAGGLSSSAVARVGDSGQEMEIKDASGRYRHARRAPVDENTLQPMRRVSKAGLESSSYSFPDI